MKTLILLLALCLIPLGGLTNAQTDVIVKKRLFSRLVVVNGINIKITRPRFRKRHRIESKKPLEMRPLFYEKIYEGLPKEIKPLYYDSIDSDRLRNLA